MNNKKHCKIIVVGVIILTLLFSIVLVNAEEGAVPSDINTDSGTVVIEDGPEKEDNSGLIAAISEAIDNIKSLYESIKLLFEEGLTGIINKTIADMLNGALSAVAGVFGTVYLVTPSLLSIPFVKKPWSFFVIISIALTSLAIIATITRIVIGQGNGEKGKKGITALLIAISFILATLFFVELGIFCQNYIWESIIAESMPELIGEEYRSLHDIPGDMVMKIAFSNYQTSISDLQMLEISDVFFNPQNGSVGGLLGLIFAMTLLILTGFIGLFRILILCIEADVSPVYLVWGALIGDQEPQAGIANLIFKSITTQNIFVGGWYLMVIFTRSEEWATFFYNIGVSPILINIIIQLLILVAVYFYWIKPHFRAVREPLTLAGGEVIKDFGAAMGGISRVGGNISHNMGWVQGESAAIKGQESADKIKDLGRKIKANDFSFNFGMDKLTSTGSKRMSNGDIMSSRIKENGSQVQKEDHEIHLGKVPSEHLVPLLETVNKKLPKGAVAIDPETGILEIKDVHYDAVIEAIKNYSFITENVGETHLDGKRYRDVELPINSMVGIKEYVSNNKNIDKDSIKYDENKPNKIMVSANKYDQVIKELNKYDFIEGLDMSSENIKEVTSVKEWKEVEMPVGMLKHVKRELEGSSKVDEKDYRVYEDSNTLIIHPDRYNKIMTEIQNSLKDRVPYWTNGNKYVVYEHGLPVLYKNPPEDGIELGSWKKANI